MTAKVQFLSFTNVSAGSLVYTPKVEAEWLTVEEAAEILRVGRYVAYKAAESGELPGVIRVGRFYRVRRSVLLGTAPGIMPD
jgi:excisionase family DNA binding protein